MNVKIVRIIARLNIGGPARNVVLLAEGLRDKGFETVLLCGEIFGTEGDMMYLAKEKGIEPVIVPELGRELSIRNDWKAFWKIYKIICKERPDVIHTHTAKAGALGRAAAMLYNLSRFSSRPPRRTRSNDIVIVHTFHGHVLHSYFGKIKTWVFIWVEKILALFTDRIITVSESLKKELVEKFRIAPQRKFSVVELGFELDGLLKLPVKEESRCLNIGIVGRLVPVKNHKMLFRTVRRIANYEPRIMAKFIIIGDGELRQELEGYVRELGIQDKVEFRGWIKDLIEIYKELDIVVLTSLNEGTPVSIVEAMAAGRPIVATKAGGVLDIVCDGKSGYLVKPNDDEAFMEKLLDLINNSEKRKRFGEYGRELVKNRFSKERLIKDMERLYNKLLNEKEVYG